ncbi:hypothetical protein [Gymnodinialimonas ulvae]|uniref:hypothetical protein n=1 Tax=Gymnodinialimonas ulvae TaxID=3126504 RepID=UPI00309A1F40
MRCFRALPVALCFAISAAPLSAQEAFTWVFNEHHPFSGGPPVLDLVATDSFAAGQGEAGGARVPRGLIWVQCVGGGDAAIRFEAFAGAAAAGDVVAFQMSDDAGLTVTLQAEIFDAEDDPVGGPEVVVSADGPELQMLATAPVVRYGLVGLTDFNIPFDLTTNQHYVAQFATACAAAASVAEPSAPAPELPVADVLIPDLGPDISGHVWTRFTQVDEGNPEGTIVRLQYAVPESDDVAIVGECLVNPGDPVVHLQVSADVAGLQNGMAADLRATIPDGRSVVLQGNVVGVGAEFGVSGVEIFTDVSNPAWLVIAGNRTVRFDRPGTGNGLTLTGNGPNTIGPFLADCAEVARLDPESGGRPSAPINAQPGYLACENFGRVSSRPTGVAQVVNFINSSDGYRALQWIDEVGAVVEITALNPGQAAAYTTDPGHIWMATDGLGNCMEMMQVPAGTTDYRITTIAQ